MGNDASLRKLGYCWLRSALDERQVNRLIVACSSLFEDDSQRVRARSSRGHVYAARNLIGSIAEVETIWRQEPLREFLQSELGDGFGLVRALFFDKPPDRTWTLGWHKDQSIAVKDNSISSTSVSRPTLKACVPHYIADDEILRRMLTLRIHLDEVTVENGPLRVIPESHVSSKSSGNGVASEVTLLARAGDVLAMRPLISHASSSSHPDTKRHRRILHLEFAENDSLPDGIEWHDFVQSSASLSDSKVAD